MATLDGMPCCPPAGAEPFTTGMARRDARRYRRRGLDAVSRRLVRLADPAGLRLLEIGAGVGALQVEVLRAGAVLATGVELSPAYEPEAAALLAEHDATGRAPRLVADLLAAPGAADAQPDATPAAAPATAPAAALDADVVLLNRVVCCTERPADLLAVAARHAGSRLAFSFPRDVWWLRAGQHVVNLLARVQRWDWRFRVHRPADLVGAAEAEGLRLERTEHGRIWQVALLVRP